MDFFRHCRRRKSPHNKLKKLLYIYIHFINQFCFFNSTGIISSETSQTVHLMSLTLPTMPRTKQICKPALPRIYASQVQYRTHYF